jgi:hypothetical protein
MGQGSRQVPVRGCIKRRVGVGVTMGEGKVQEHGVMTGDRRMHYVPVVCGLKAR